MKTAYYTASTGTVINAQPVDNGPMVYPDVRRSEARTEVNN